MEKVFLWLFPVLCFMVLFKYGDYFTSQSFYGTFVSTSMINLLDKNQIMNTLLQTLFWISLVIGVIDNSRDSVDK